MYTPKRWLPRFVLLLFALTAGGCGNEGLDATSLSVTLTYRAGENGTVSGPAEQSVLRGGDASPVTAVAAPGYHFVSWSDGSKANPRTDRNVSNDATYTARFAINRYTLVYRAGENGTIVGATPQTLSPGGDGSEVVAVPLPGYHFVSWSDGSTANARTDRNVTTAAAYTARFAPNVYTLTYAAGANGAIEGAASQSVSHGKQASEVRAVAAPGCHFVSWSDGSTANPRTDRNVTADASLVATFGINRYTVAYSAGEGGAVEGPPVQTVTHGADGTRVTAVPALGYHFAGWSDGVASSDRRETGLAADVRVTARFAVNRYTLAYAAGESGSIGGTSPQVVDHGRDGTSVSAVPAPGYHFVAWSDGSTANPRVDRNVRADASVRADFEVNRYAWTYSAGEGGSVEGESVQTVKHGSDATTVRAVPGPGYHFVGWSDGVTRGDRTDTEVTTEGRVTARFEINRYTVTYAAGANGSVAPAGPQTVTHGADGAPVTAVPAVGYHFVGWSDGATANPRTDKNVTGSASVSAEFAINRYTVRYVAGEGGSVQGLTPQTVAHGSGAGAVTAAAAEGYHFVRWSDGVATPLREDKNVTGDLSFTAAVELNTYRVGGTVSGLVEGTQVVLQNRGGDDLKVAANGSFTFGKELLSRSSYAVTVLSQPRAPNQTCTITKGTGTVAAADVTDVGVQCRINTYAIGGVVSGLPPGGQLVLRNNGGDELPVRGNGPFTFPKALEDGSAYAVKIQSQRLKPHWFCLVENGAGNLTGGDVRDVGLVCLAEPALDAAAGIRRIDLRWNTDDFDRGVVFNLCRAGEDFSAAGFKDCGTTKSGVLEEKVQAPRALTDLNNDTAYWFQLEAVYANGRRTFSKIVEAIPFGGLNDTGVDWAADDLANRGMDGTRAEKSAGCQAAASTHPDQDALCGRDATARGRALTKSGGGSAGFDFTKVCMNGDVAGKGRCPGSPSLGNGANNWACVRDNVTGLTWEVKTREGLHSQDNTYTWFNPDAASNGGAPGVQNGGACSGSGCDTRGFVEAVNAAGLCGASDWRLPTRRELLSIVDNGRFGPAVDGGFFPNTLPAFFWSSSPYADQQSSAWQVYFKYGEAYANPKNEARSVRLVRGRTATFGFNNP